MPELTTDFKSLPEEYQHVIRLAEDTYHITVAPLQLLVGGWSAFLQMKPDVLNIASSSWIAKARLRNRMKSRVIMP